MEDYCRQMQCLFLYFTILNSPVLKFLFLKYSYLLRISDLTICWLHMRTVQLREPSNSYCRLLRHLHKRSLNLTSVGVHMYVTLVCPHRNMIQRKFIAFFSNLHVKFIVFFQVRTVHPEVSRTIIEFDSHNKTQSAPVILTR